MCILFIAIDQHPRYPLIIAANRDEFFARPSRAAHFWEDAPQILAGRDLQAGGTWLGVNKGGRVAALTNLRAPDLYRPEARSRGELVVRYLQSGESNAQYGNFLGADYASYNPFNLLFGTVDRLDVFSTLAPVATPLEAGFHSISNGLLDDYWPKMSRGVSLLEHHIAQAGELDLEQLAAVMRDATQADDASLPVTGISQTEEKLLSSIFIHGDEYGTRTTSLLLFGHSGIRLVEYSYEPQGRLSDTRSFAL